MRGSVPLAEIGVTRPVIEMPPPPMPGDTCAETWAEREAATDGRRAIGETGGQANG